MPRQPPGHARVCRRHRPMCAGSAAICSTALNWRAGASSRVFSPGPGPASPPRWTRWNRSSPGISRRAFDPAPPVRHTAPCHPTRNGSALPTMGWLGSASDGRQAPCSPRICGAYGPHPVIARRPAIAFAQAGSVRADGRAPLICGTAVRCALTCRVTLAVPPAMPVSGALACQAFRSRTFCRGVWQGSERGTETRSLAHGHGRVCCAAGWRRHRLRGRAPTPPCRVRRSRDPDDAWLTCWRIDPGAAVTAGRRSPGPGVRDGPECPPQLGRPARP